ncbi:MAG: hypothetical protein J6V00_05210 [Bacteroidaceae bacterium]|nr:hypothetical protein [Bacteroidaceae bacterium]
MFYNLGDIKEAVRIALDENRVSDNLMDIDTLSLDEIICSKIEEAVNDIHSRAPIYMLEPGNISDDEVMFAESIAWEKEEGKGPGWTILPNDFHRLIGFKMSDWERPVYSAILPDDPLYALQKSRFAGVRGNTQKPVCAIVMRSVGRVLEFFSCAEGEGVYVDMAVYLPVSKIKEEGINICERCYKSVVYKVAGLAAVNMGMVDKANALFEISNGLLK